VGGTVLVLGATGKTGRRLVPLLTDRGVRVRAASRNPGPGLPGADEARFDWFAEATYDQALDGVDALYVIPPAVVDPTEQVGAVLEHAVRTGVRRVVLLSALGVDLAEADVPQRRVERLVDASGIPGVVLRPGAFMENFSEHHWSGSGPAIQERGELAVPAGDARVSFVSCRDIAEVAAITLTEDGHEGKGYTLTGPAALSYTEAAEIMSEAAGRPVHYVDSDPQAIRTALLATGAPADYADLMTGLFLASVSSGAMATVTGDIATVTGHSPTTFAEYARAAADAWR
jgi:uncharacterized protein YbjT (DUF2867 family)